MAMKFFSPSKRGVTRRFRSRCVRARAELPQIYGQPLKNDRVETFHPRNEEIFDSTSLYELRDIVQ